MGKSDLLKEGLKGGLNGLLSSTSTYSCRWPSTSYSHEVLGHRQEYVTQRNRECGHERILGT